MPHLDGITPLYLVILKLFVKSGTDGTGTPPVSLFTGHTLPCCGHSSQGHGTKHSLGTWYVYVLDKPACILVRSYKNTFCLFLIIRKCGCNSLLSIHETNEFIIFIIVPVCMLVHPRLCGPTLLKAIFYSNTTTLGCVYQQA